jgi:hypothetical protein
LGGKLRITSAKGRGTSLRATFPVSENSAGRPGRKVTKIRASTRGAVRR